ncbi:site-specific integrase [Haloglycomyces albus]|uniref:site-specific integrase n=1 Tax=Haloglycomyces albus TaxID=526067 RepID=UPI00046CF339|nr:site-specific integrase [Haloglycomyces albus]
MSNEGRKKNRYGEGTIFWDTRRSKFVGRLSFGFRPDGRRDVRVAEGASRAEVRREFRKIKDEYNAAIEPGKQYSIRQATLDWLRYGLKRQGKTTRDKYESLAKANIIPLLGAAKVKELRAEQVDEWLEVLAQDHATSTLRLLLSMLRRILRFAEARGKASRNVAMLVDSPDGKAGRPSKSMTREEAKKCLEASRGSWIHAYIALSVFTGVRTEEARPLQWKHVHLNPVAEQECSCGTAHRETSAPHVEVWRSVRNKAETKTPKSRRTIALPQQVVVILTAHKVRAELERESSGVVLSGDDYVFSTRVGSIRDAANVRRDLRKVIKEAGIRGHWTPREFRHTFVSLLSDEGAREELIADLVGHKRTSTTRTIYRHQIRPVITSGAEVLDKVIDQDF